MLENILNAQGRDAEAEEWRNGSKTSKRPMGIWDAEEAKNEGLSLIQIPNSHPHHTNDV
jgi:hypothetical protein